jgi:hypothetical protein
MDESIPDYGTDGVGGLPDSPSTVPEPLSQEVPVGGQGLTAQSPTPVPAKLTFERGGRARELACAIEVQFGKMSCDKANYEVARRFCSRHMLVTSCSVRYSHQAALIKRALEIYFILAEVDLVDTWAIFNKKNMKRTTQRQMVSS